MARVSLQSPLLQAALRRPTAQLIPRCTSTTLTTPMTNRTFSHLPTLRPTMTPSPSPIFRAANQTLLTRQGPTTMTAMTNMEGPLDVIAKSSISAHPALAGVASQIRCGPRATMAGASRLIQKRRHGFLSRIRTIGGRKTLMRRRAKGRKRLAA
ncbi:hypothetical protein C8A00DRAFT_11590 [Chaetomidium leptoderma]|uniref:Ribosomal protein L34 n=1 Tax=Chaetomidium leptoderma TaxID=669021 RepID=A0AAN6VUN2_9PEZI|nr:hypothetical protein C8A00DRAFT_11590 [Chaetomidium leptoderma]